MRLDSSAEMEMSPRSGFKVFTVGRHNRDGFANLGHESGNSFGSLVPESCTFIQESTAQLSKVGLSNRLVGNIAAVMVSTYGKASE